MIRNPFIKRSFAQQLTDSLPCTLGGTAFRCKLERLLANRNACIILSILFLSFLIGVVKPAVCRSTKCRRCYHTAVDKVSDILGLETSASKARKKRI